MPRGFFAKSTLLVSKQPLSRIPKCGACGLLKTCLSPKMPVSGEGRRKILVVAEAPGKEEDKQGIQLVGNSGQELVRHLSRYGIKMRRDCWLTNSVICRPPENRKPTDLERGYCHPNLLNAIEQLQPEVILALGQPALASVMRAYWSEPVTSISQWAGFRIPLQKINTWVIPTFHPAHILRAKGAEQQQLTEMFSDHISFLEDVDGRPWKVIPDYTKKIECILDPRQAAKILREFKAAGGIIAFDYETNMLKPDSEHAVIVSCSVCWRGKRTIAYPFMGEAVKATEELLYSDCPKIGANIQFEERWSLKQWGRPIPNWYGDTVVDAHILDNRPDITSVKFQAMVRFGVETYDEHIKPLLKAKKGQKINQIIKEVDINQLLLYNGMDSLIEYKIGKQQAGELNREWPS